ncbi:S1 family peptidase [Christensenellaceae bacterium OttesenSCG-928-M15]|nr:S1 family peptidase [Christensenellaceae bacterium OttesenSCG-928-M15]
MKKVLKNITIVILILVMVFPFSITALAISDSDPITEKTVLEMETDGDAKIADIENIYVDPLLKADPRLDKKDTQANDKYIVLLTEWAFDKNNISDLDAKFPEFYGGCYIDENKDLIILVTDISEEIREYFSRLIDMNNVILKKVQYSYSELLNEHDKITSAVLRQSKNQFVEAIAGVGISMQQNAVALYIVPETADTLKKARASVTSFPGVVTIEAEGKDKTTAAIYPGDRMAFRSAGFWAYRNGVLGLVTCGHNTSQGETIYQGTGATAFGTAEKVVFSGTCDASFVKRTNSSFTPSRSVSGHGFSLHPSGYISILAVGANVYSRGYITGAKSGTVKDNNYTASYGIRSLILTDVTAGLGDSGGVVAASGNSSTRYITGIISGRSGANKMIYCRYDIIKSNLGITLY